jgi:hypothetical protein
MKFRVFAEGVSSSYDDERSHYLVREDGVLEVFTADARKGDLLAHRMESCRPFPA